MTYAASEIEGLFGRPPGLCNGDVVGKGLDIVIDGVITHPSSVNNIGQVDEPLLSSCSSQYTCHHQNDIRYNPRK